MCLRVACCRPTLDRHIGRASVVRRSYVGWASVEARPLSAWLKTNTLREGRWVVKSEVKSRNWCSVCARYDMALKLTRYDLTLSTPVAEGVHSPSPSLGSTRGTCKSEVSCWNERFSSGNCHFHYARFRSGTTECGSRHIGGNRQNYTLLKPKSQCSRYEDASHQRGSQMAEKIGEEFNDGLIPKKPKISNGEEKHYLVCQYVSTKRIQLYNYKRPQVALTAKVGQK